MDLSKINVSVPDLSKLGKPKALENPPVAAVVHPGDQVVVLLPESATPQEIQNVSEFLKQWAPTVSWLVTSGILNITVIPTQSLAVGDKIRVAGTPLPDRSPQGPIAVETLPDGLCSDREDHDPHIVTSGSLAPYKCTADQSTREPNASEKARKEPHDDQG